MNATDPKNPQAASYGFIRDDVAVFDLRPANVILEDSGLIVPIDSIPVRLSDGTRRMFE